MHQAGEQELRRAVGGEHRGPVVDRGVGGAREDQLLAALVRDAADLEAVKDRALVGIALEERADAGAGGVVHEGEIAHPGLFCAVFIRDARVPHRRGQHGGLIGAPPQVDEQELTLTRTDRARETQPGEKQARQAHSAERSSTKPHQ